MARKNPLARKAEMWDVVIAAHEVKGPRVTYAIPARTACVGSCANSNEARRLVLGWAHKDAGVPPWKPYLRLSWPHTRATRRVIEVE